MAAGGGRADRTMFALAARCASCQRTLETRDMVEETGRVDARGGRVHICLECFNVDGGAAVHARHDARRRRERRGGGAEGAA